MILILINFIQVFDDSVDSFNAVLYGHQDFELTPLRIYSGSVLDETEMPNPGETGDENQIIVHFDYATGAIGKVIFLFKI